MSTASDLLRELWYFRGVVGVYFGWHAAAVQTMIIISSPFSFYVALNTSSKTAIKARTHLMGFAVFGGASLVRQLRHCFWSLLTCFSAHPTRAVC